MNRMPVLDPRLDRTDRLRSKHDLEVSDWPVDVNSVKAVGCAHIWPCAGPSPPATLLSPLIAP